MSVASQKRRPFNADFNPGNRYSQVRREGGGDAPVLSRCSLLRNPWPKPIGVLEHCLEGETNCWFSIFSRSFLLAASQRPRGLSLYISLFSVAVLVTYTTEFLYFILGNSGIDLKLLLFSFCQQSQMCRHGREPVQQKEKKLTGLPNRTRSCICLRVCQVHVFVCRCGVQSCTLSRSVSFASATISCETFRNLCRSWIWQLAARPLTPEGGLEPGIVCHNICGGLSGTETGISPSTSVTPCDCHYTNVTHTHTHTHTLILSRESKNQPAKRGNLETKPPSLDVGQHWTERTSTLFL